MFKLQFSQFVNKQKLKYQQLNNNNFEIKKIFCLSSKYFSTIKK